MTISVHATLGQEVASRAAVRFLVRTAILKLNLSKSSQLILDFSEVVFVARSAMHELLTSKLFHENFQSHVIFQKMNEDVQAMHDIVSKTKFASEPPVKELQIIRVDSIEDIPEFDA